MKKILFIFAIVMTLMLTACGGRQTKAVETTDTEVETVVEDTIECCGANADTLVVETVAEEVVDAE